MLSAVHGSISVVQEVKATLTFQGMSFVAVAFGTSGNGITMEFTPGATKGAEVVTVVGSAISIQIDDGVSDFDDIAAAILGSAPASALVTTSSSGATTVEVDGPDSFTGGINGVAGFSIDGVSSVTQSGVGELTIILSDAWYGLQECDFQIMSATAQDLIPQIKSVNLTTKTIVLNLLAAAVPTDPTSACTIYMMSKFKNSSLRY